MFDIKYHSSKGLRVNCHSNVVFKDLDQILYLLRIVGKSLRHRLNLFVCVGSHVGDEALESFQGVCFLLCDDELDTKR